MIKKVIDALVAALEFVLGSKANVVALKKEVADRDKIIADLQAAIEAENAEIAVANEKADALAAQITADPEVPVVVDGNEVTEQ